MVSRIKEYYSELSNEKIGYVGRLDPMAHGVMVYLVAEENKNRADYEKLNKHYKTKILFGVQTDSYDSMGIITNNYDVDEESIYNLKNIINNYFKDNKGVILQKYPPFSSAVINGERLYKLSRENRLDGNKLPEKEVFVYKYIINSHELVESKDLLPEIIYNISNVKGDFRQAEIINQWKLFKNRKLLLLSIEFEVSSGTYIRSLANEFGGIALEIFRNKVGEFSIEDSTVIM